MNLNFMRHQPLGLRVWHWLNAIAVTGLLLTVALHKTFLNPRKNATLIQEKLKDSGVTVSFDIARQAARAMRERMFDWHYYFGFLLTAALILRIVVALLHNDYPWKQALTGFGYFRKSERAERSRAFHFAVVKIGYLSFYIAILIMILTGLSMYFSDFLNLTKDRHHTLHEIHEFFLWYFVIFLFAHVLGVVIREFTSDRGLISNMIHGGKKDP